MRKYDSVMEDGERIERLRNMKALSDTVFRDLA